MTTQENIFSAQLREAREKAGHSQADLAFNLGCDRKTVTRWEAGRHRVSGIFRRQLRGIYPVLASVQAA